MAEKLGYLVAMVTLIQLYDLVCLLIYHNMFYNNDLLSKK